jgi:diguanylate cyclase (GGDEF)-like protein
MARLNDSAYADAFGTSSPLGADDMDFGRDTLLAIPVQAIAPGKEDACLVQIYPTGPSMGLRFGLTALSLVFGRDKDSDIYLEDHSVSRRHARIELRSDGYYLVDLGSTNGTLVNDMPADEARLHDGDYLRIGNCIFRYLAGGNVEAEYHEEIYRLTIIDALTGIHNKRYLMDFLDRELARSARHKRPLSLALLDIDRFKCINDQLGHLGGDHTLRELAALVKRAIRKEELFARYGGEEFALVLPETTLQGAVQAAERIRQLVEHNAFTYEDVSFRITISVGVVTSLGDDFLAPTELIGRADHQLYAAKNAGRNRVSA